MICVAINITSINFYNWKPESEWTKKFNPGQTTVVVVDPAFVTLVYSVLSRVRRGRSYKSILIET